MTCCSDRLNPHRLLDGGITSGHSMFYRGFRKSEGMDFKRNGLLKDRFG